MYSTGILLAFVAMLAWAIGDFSIQRSSRAFGPVLSLFYICFFGAVVLLPFAWNDIPRLFVSEGFWIVLLAGVILFFTALFDFEALKRGKIAVIQPIIGMELPLTIALGIFLHGEHLSFPEYLAAAIIFFGIMFAVRSDRLKLKDGKTVLERGAIFAGVGAIGLALSNLLIGLSSQETSPLFTIWFTNLVIALLCLVYLVWTRRLHEITDDLKRRPRMLLIMCVSDNLAWTCFAYATTMIPIGVATTVSECYVALDVLLGLVVNKERVKPHQKLGVAAAVCGLLILAYLKQG